MIGFIFGIQSKSDVITNSSSELFVFKNQETAEEVVNLLDTIYPKWRSEYREPIEASELNNDELLWLLERFTSYSFWSEDIYSRNPEVFKIGKRNRTLKECELPKFLGLTEEETYRNWETWDPCDNGWENKYLQLSDQCYSKFKEWCIKNHIISLFSIDENPEWEKQEILMNYAERITWDKIKERASQLHDIEVNQKYDTHPYSYHLFSVASIADEYMKSYYGFAPGSKEYNTLFFAACFHDSIEDARQTYNDVKKIAAEFENVDPEFAADLVYALTTEKDKTRKERGNEKYYQGIRETPFAGFLKLCDRYANMLYSKKTGSRMYGVYKSELPEFLEHIKDCSCNLPGELVDKIREL